MEIKASARVQTAALTLQCRGVTCRQKRRRPPYPGRNPLDPRGDRPNGRYITVHRGLGGKRSGRSCCWSDLGGDCDYVVYRRVLGDPPERVAGGDSVSDSAAE
jgi:hypothetical protein